VTARTKAGKILEREQSDYEGGLGNPISWEREVEKFNWLSEQFADASLRREIIELVADLDQHSIGDLMNLLAKVSPRAVSPATHHTFQ
jgi:2-methylcitrate dehydratase